MNKIVVAVLVTAIITGVASFMGGFLAGVYSTEFGKEMLEATVAFEEPADTNNPLVYETDHLIFRYPGNWKIDDDAEYFDSEFYFSIDTPGSNYVSFEVTLTRLSELDQVNDWIDYFEKLFTINKKMNFDRWGDFEGTGMHIFGTYLGDPVEARIFSFSSEEYCFTVAEFYDTAATPNVQPGYKQIEDTFKWTYVPAYDDEANEDGSADGDSNEKDDSSNEDADID